VAGEFVEVEVLVERLRRVVDAVEDDGDERECQTRLVTVPERLEVLHDSGGCG
jgi:hypothetical protein